VVHVSFHMAGLPELLKELIIKELGGRSMDSKLADLTSVCLFFFHKSPAFLPFSAIPMEFTAVCHATRLLV
jgi:hypothetical protein